MTAAYNLFPVGRRGVDLRRVRVVEGPQLRDTPSPGELIRQLVRENERLRRALDVAEARTVAGEVERLQGLLDVECGLRARAQRRLGVVAVCLSAIARAFPQAADVVEKAREEIWRAGDV